MPFFGFLMACFLFSHFSRRFRHHRMRIGEREPCGGGWDHPWGAWERRARREGGSAAREAARHARRQWREGRGGPAKPRLPGVGAVRTPAARPADDGGL